MKKKLTGLLAVLTAVMMIFSVIPAFAADYKVGDVDGDGNITAADARLALQAAIELIAYPKGSREALACDADLNGAIEVEDARLILRGAVGLDMLHTHNYKTETVTKAPTCVATGEKKLSCECGAFITDTVAATGAHTWDAGVTSKAPTCAANGTKTYTCTVCKTATKTENIAMTDSHIWNSGVVSKAATCAAEGEKLFTCTVCKKTKTEKIAVNKANHTGKTRTENAVAATCLESGMSGDVYCADCGTLLSASTVVNKLGHDYVRMTDEPSCYEEGRSYDKCSRCGDTVEIAKIPPTENHKVEEVTVDASCTADGYKVRKCVNGDCTYYIPESYEVTTPPTGHDRYEDTAARVAPTCTEQGYSVFRCRNCDSMERDNYTAPTGHKPGAFSVKENATCTEDGVKTAKCTVCGETVEQVISAFGHTVSSVQNTKECKLEVKCTVCNKVFASQTSHRFRTPKEEKATCIKTGTRSETCRDCGYTLVTELPLSQHTLASGTEFAPATCTADGHIIYGGGTCSVCNEYIAPSTVVLPAKGHNPGPAATCTLDQKCNTCGEIVTEKLGHDYKQNTVFGHDVNGFYCTRCGEKSTDKSELINTFNGIVNGMKNYRFYNAAYNNTGVARTATVVGKTVMKSTYTKFDFGIYTNIVKDLYDEEMDSEEETYDKLKTKQSISQCPAAYDFVSRLTGDDIDSITVEKINGITGAEILGNYSDTYTRNDTQYDLTPYKNINVNKAVIKVTVDVKNEMMSPKGCLNVPDDRDIDTPIMKAFPYDIREERDVYDLDDKVQDGDWTIDQSDEGDGFSIGMIMTLEKLSADLKFVYYLDAENYDPIAATYELDTTMSQDVAMKFKIGLLALDGNIKPVIDTTNHYAYLFSDYFPVQ